MKGINITDKAIIYNDMPRGWTSIKYQPRWHKKVYQMWRDMWDRVYTRLYWFGSLIHPSFKYLSNYINWIESQPRFEEFCNTCDRVRWSVDKDAKYLGNKNYYPEYMTLMTVSENTIEVINRKDNPKSKQPVIGISLDKTKKIILTKSTLDVINYGFIRRHVSSCLNKKRKTHKGYKWLRLSYSHNKMYRLKEGDILERIR